MLCRVPSPSNIQMIMTTDILTYVRHVVFLFPKVQIFVYIFVFLFVYSFRFFIHLFINIIYLFIYLFVIIFSISFVPYHYTIFLVQNASLFSWHPRSGCGQRTDCTFRGWGAQGNGGGHWWFRWLWVSQDAIIRLLAIIRDHFKNKLCYIFRLTWLKVINIYIYINTIYLYMQ